MKVPPIGVTNVITIIVGILAIAATHAFIQHSDPWLAALGSWLVWSAFIVRTWVWYTKRQQRSASGLDIEELMETWSQITNDLMATTIINPNIPLLDRKFDWVNEAWSRQLGLTVIEVYSSRIRDLIHPDDLEPLTHRQERLDTISSPETLGCRIRCRMKGIDCYRHYKWSTITSEGRLYLTGRDAEAERRHRKQIKRAIADLESRNDDLERFASVAAHQLRSPPRTIMGIAQALREDYGDLLDPEGQQFLEDIRTDANQMADIVDGLFRFSKVRTSDDLDIEPVDINTVLREVKATRAKKRCSMCENGPGCPHVASMDCPNKRETIQFDGMPVVLGDRLLLREVLSNLIDNGIKFNESSEKVIHISAVRKPPDRWSLVVKDNGIGIDPLYHSKLFTMFQRVHPQYAGTGVGLALVAAIVSKMGGSIQVKSAVGEGSTFSFDLKEAWL